MPAPIASTFFSAPAISQPTTSGFVYTRNVGAKNSCCSSLGDRGVGDRDDRRGRLPGRDLAREVRAGEHADARGVVTRRARSHATSVIRASVPCSMPLARLTIGTVGPMNGARVGEHRAQAVRRHAEHDHVGVGARLLERRGRVQRVGQARRPGRYVGVLVRRRRSAPRARAGAPTAWSARSRPRSRRPRSPTTPRRRPRRCVMPDRSGATPAVSGSRHHHASSPGAGRCG